MRTTSYVLRLPNGSGDYDGSIIVGGARSDFFSEHTTWYDNVDDSTLIESAKHSFDNYMQEHFVRWEDSGAYVKQIWTGIMGYSSDTFPSIGAVPGKEGCFIAAGFEGHGMPVIYLAMKGIAEMVTKGKTFEEVGIPGLYKATKERLENDVDVLDPRK